jgi:hypothetical protein
MEFPKVPSFSEALLLFFFFILIVTILISCFSSKFSISLRGEYLLDYSSETERKSSKRMSLNNIKIGRYSSLLPVMVVDTFKVDEKTVTA